MSLLAALLLTSSTRLGFAPLYPGASLGLRADHGQIEARLLGSSKEVRDGHFSGWGWSLRGDVEAHHVLIGAEVNSVHSQGTDKTAWYPKLGATWSGGRAELLLPDDSVNKTAGLRLSHHVPGLQRLWLEWEADRFRDGEGATKYGGKIVFSWGLH